MQRLHVLLWPICFCIYPYIYLYSYAYIHIYIYICIKILINIIIYMYRLYVLLWSIYFSTVGTSIFMYVDNRKVIHAKEIEKEEMKSRREWWSVGIIEPKSPRNISFVSVSGINRNKRRLLSLKGSKVGANGTGRSSFISIYTAHANMQKKLRKRKWNLGESDDDVYLK
jgi:hypothetical protein